MLLPPAACHDRGHGAPTAGMALRGSGATAHKATGRRTLRYARLVTLALALALTRTRTRTLTPTLTLTCIFCSSSLLKCTFLAIVPSANSFVPLNMKEVECSLNLSAPCAPSADRAPPISVSESLDPGGDRQGTGHNIISRRERRTTHSSQCIESQRLRGNVAVS